MSDLTERLRRNDESRSRAEHFREPWSQDEIELLMTFWGQDPEAEVAETLGRTIEACRQRFYEVRRAERSWTVTMKTTTTTTHEVSMTVVCRTCYLEISTTGACGCWT